MTDKGNAAEGTHNKEENGGGVDLCDLLDEHVRDRKAVHTRRCVFCRKNFTDTWGVLFDHMREEHGFHAGQPDNMIHIHTFLDTLQAQLDAFCCIYCKRTFTDYDTLKLHMRKKKHFRIPPSDCSFDRFYLVNYLHDSNWRTLSEESSDSDVDWERNFRDDWGDWVSPTTTTNNNNNNSNSTTPTNNTETLTTLSSSSTSPTQNKNSNNKDHTNKDNTSDVLCGCLMCEEVFGSAELCLSHMQEQHKLCLRSLVKSLALDELGVIRLINFMRSQSLGSKIVPSSIDEIASETLLRPVVADDPLLCYDFLESDVDDNF